MLLLEQVLEKGMDDAITHHNEGHIGSLCARHKPAHSLIAHLNPACMGTNIFILTGDIGSRGQGKRGVRRKRRTQEPAGEGEGGMGAGGNAGDRGGAEGVIEPILENRVAVGSRDNPAIEERGAETAGGAGEARDAQTDPPLTPSKSGERCNTGGGEAGGGDKMEATTTDAGATG